MAAEYGTKLRLLRVLKAIQEWPFHYKKRQLAQLYDCDPDTIKSDFEAIRNAGFDLIFDSKYRYGFSADKPFEELKEMLELAPEDQLRLLKALENLAPKDQKFEALKRKLASLFDFSSKEQLLMRRPYISKIKLLENAQEAKRQVILVDYHSSNSNRVSDRQVEAFYFKAEEDMIQAFDVDKQALKHFRISRIRRIRLTETAWAHETQHKVLATDPFRIVDDQQVRVHLRLKVGAYNELIERFPLSKAYIQEDALEEGVFDFQCWVNHRFFGITNFILGYYHQIVEIIEPESLKSHLREAVEGMKFK